MKIFLTDVLIGIINDMKEKETDIINISKTMEKYDITREEFNGYFNALHRLGFKYKIKANTRSTVDNHRRKKSEKSTFDNVETYGNVLKGFDDYSNIGYSIGYKEDTRYYE